ncbi:taurine ABC transporter substrate-binding protein [bacterium 1xD42-67]|nr:taurine ABC transporter substrate-binding protein [bacterium 1xD42-67]
MKKLTSLLLAAAMVMALAACGNSGGDKSGTNVPPPSGGSSQGGASGTQEPAGPEPITLNLAYMPNYASLWGVLSADSQGFFAEEGITVVLNEFPDGPSEIAAMESGKIDLAYIGKGAHRLCVLGNAVIFAPSSVHTTDKIVIHPNSGIEKMEDLRGKTIAFNSGSTSETTFDNALKVAGLTRDDVDGYDMSIDNMVPAMVSGSVDAAVCWNPYSGQILEQVEGAKEIEFSDGSTNISSWICLPKYAEENHDVLVRFSRALYKGMDWGSKPENYDAVAKLCADQIKSNVESQLAQVGDAHWFNLDDIKTGASDGTIKGYYENMQNDFVQAETLKPEEVVEDVSQFVLFDVIEEAVQ